MSLEKSAPEEIQEMLQPLTDEGFRFACHPGVPCFTECCRDLKLLLTPYDILRLKNHLGLESGDFLDRFVDVQFDEQRNLPMVYLNMQNHIKSQMGGRIKLDQVSQFLPTRSGRQKTQIVS